MNALLLNPDIYTISNKYFLSQEADFRHSLSHGVKMTLVPAVSLRTMREIFGIVLRIS